MEPIIVSIPGKKSPQKQKEAGLLASCKYFKGEDQMPFKDSSSPEACFWDVERIAVREASRPESIMLQNAQEDLARVDLPSELTDVIPAPVIQVAFVVFGKQSTYPYWHPEFASAFAEFLRGGYGSNLV